VNAYVLAPRAKADLITIHAGIAAERPQAAGRIILMLRDVCQRLADHPGIGRPWPEPGVTDARIYTKDGYTVVYRAETPLRVLRILARGRDLGGAL